MESPLPHLDGNGLGSAEPPFSCSFGDLFHFDRESHQIYSSRSLGVLHTESVLRLGRPLDILQRMGCFEPENTIDVGELVQHDPPTDRLAVVPPTF